MAVATLLKRSGGETFVNGFPQLDLVHIYQVIAPRNSSATTILHWPGVPRTGTKVSLGGSSAWVGRVTFEHPELDQDRFLVTVPYSNQTANFERDINGNPVSDPTQIAKRVTINWVDKSEPVTSAKFLGITKGLTLGEGGQAVDPPPWLKKNSFGPVTNSTGAPIHRLRTRRLKVITVQRVERNWNSQWDVYQGAINSDVVTIVVRDSTGVRATHTFARYTLRMSIKTPEEWKDSKMYFRPSFIMEHNPKTWIHAEVDRGQKRRVFVGQRNPEGGNYDAGDLTDLKIDSDWGFNSITTNKDTVAIGEPVLLNGWGAEQPLTRVGSGTYQDGDAFYLNYDIDNNIRPFAPLNL